MSQLSYWEQQSFTTYDHIVVGAGIVGLSTAIELKERFPSASVLVLERGLLPTGASSRNAGFACMGSLTELLDDLNTLSRTEVCELFDARKRGLERLRVRLGDSNIGYAARGSYELIAASGVSALERMEEVNELLLPITGKAAFLDASERIASFGFNTLHVSALIENSCEGELHTGRMMKALLHKALSLGIEVMTGAEVLSFEDSSTQVYVEVKELQGDGRLLLHAGTLSICTNAFTPQLLPEEDVKPGRGQVLITQPIEGLKLKGIFHMDKGYYYFREIDGRILIGGGRNLDFEGETTHEFALTEQIQTELERRLHEIIIPGRPFLVEQRWAGIMAFGNTRKPIVKQVSTHVYGAFRMGGMGVALGSEVAMQLADIIAR